MTDTAELTPLQRLTKNCRVQTPEDIRACLLGMQRIPSKPVGYWKTPSPWPWPTDTPAFGMYWYEVSWNRPGTRHQLEEYLQYPETAADARFHLAALDEYESMVQSVDTSAPIE